MDMKVSGFGDNHRITPKAPKGESPIKKITIKSFENIQSIFNSVLDQKPIGEKYPLRKRAKKLKHPPLKKQVQGFYPFPKNFHR